MSFEITFLGSSGGPVEGTTCSIMIKPRKVSYQDILTKKLYHQLITIDAGSGLAQLTETIYNEIHTQQPTSKHLLWYQDSLPVNEYIKSTITMPFKDFGTHINPFKLAQQIICKMSSYLITHPHLDHIASLVINSAGFSRLNPKNIYGSECTIDALERYIFNGIIWPNMPRFGVVNLFRKEYREKWIVGENVDEKKKNMDVLTKRNIDLFLTENERKKSKSEGAKSSIPKDLPSLEDAPLSTTSKDQPTSKDATDSETEQPVFSVEMFELSHGELIRTRKSKSKTSEVLKCDTGQDSSYDEVIECCASNQYECLTPSTGSLNKNDEYNIINGHTHEHYLSSAFLVTQNLDNSSLLIFGDFESDAISTLDDNLRIWKHIAPLITSPDNPLKGIILECSNSNDTSLSELYGHLIPFHLIRELKVLEKLCLAVNPTISQPLKDFPIIINHVKESVIGGGALSSEFHMIEDEFHLQDPRKHVMEQLDELNKKENLGIKFSMALSGVTIEL